MFFSKRVRLAKVVVTRGFPVPEVISRGVVVEPEVSHTRRGVTRPVSSVKRHGQRNGALSKTTTLMINRRQLVSRQ